MFGLDKNVLCILDFSLSLSLLFFFLPLSLPPPYFFSRRRACECTRASCDVILVLSLWLLQVTWKWGNDRDVSWKSFSGLASSISNSNSSRTRDVGVAGGGTQFCWTSGLSTRMTSQFVDESSFRCRLLLNAQDAGRWVWFLNVAHELFLGNG